MTHTQDQSSAAAREVRHLFQRVLGAWAMDILSLRRAGLDRPSVRAGSPFALVAPPAGIGRRSGAPRAHSPDSGARTRHRARARYEGA